MIIVNACLKLQIMFCKLGDTVPQMKVINFALLKGRRL